MQLSFIRLDHFVVFAQKMYSQILKKENSSISVKINFRHFFV